MKILISYLNCFKNSFFNKGETFSLAMALYIVIFKFKSIYSAFIKDCFVLKVKHFNLIIFFNFNFRPVCNIIDFCL